MSLLKDSILISVGEYRDRSRAQDDLTINGKIIAVHKENGGYRIVSRVIGILKVLVMIQIKILFYPPNRGPAGG